MEETTPPNLPLTGEEKNREEKRMLNKRGILGYNVELKVFARENRKNPTKPENRIWKEILCNNKTGYKFLRQKPINNFILDFYCSKLLLGIEIDGNSHYRDSQRKYDIARADRLEDLGIKLIRYTNDEIMSNIDGVYKHLMAELKKRENESPLVKGGWGD